jgi:two-component system OmpR family sensor kinase
MSQPLHNSLRLRLIVGSALGVILAVLLLVGGTAWRLAQGPVELQVLATPQPALSVRDHGPGLSPEALAQMQQRHARIGSHHIGYGLGMSIVRLIADKHAAELVLISPPAEGGSGLSVRLVFAQAAAAQD